MAKTSKTSLKTRTKSRRTKAAAKPVVATESPTPVKRRPKRLPSIVWLTKRTGQILWQHKKTFAILVLVYGLLNIVLVNGLSGSTDVAGLKHDFSQLFTGKFGSLASSASIFVLLLGSTGSNNSAGGFQLFLTLIISLAVIWTLRQTLAARGNVSVRDAFYLGMYPLIPFILVLLVIGLQLIPLIIGSTLYSLVIGNAIAVTLVEKLFWLVVFIALACLSLYFLSSSILAVYIVTLPEMPPLKALRSARELVKGRRLQVIRKVLWLPILLLLASSLIMLPIILWLTALAQVVFFILSMLVLIVVHTYMYSLYRELLHE
jgi:hypothetical protein